MAGYISSGECIAAHFQPKKYQLRVRVQVQDPNRSAEVVNFECFFVFATHPKGNNTVRT